MIRKVSDDTILAETEAFRVRYRRGRLRVDDRKAGSEIISYSLHDSVMNRMLSKFRLSERVLRLNPRLCCKISESQFLFSCKGKLFRADCEKKAVELETVFPKGTNNPLSLCVAADGTVYYGEYSWNPDREEVGIFYRDHGEWTKYCEFPKHSILHIHSMIDDPTRNCLWVFTGDADRESGIWKIDKSTRTIEPFLVGAQVYRACYGFVNETDIVYATDTPLQENAIYAVNIETKKVTKLCDMPGPCIYGKSFEYKGRRYHCFATSVEPDSSLSSLRYRLTYKLGKGVSDRKSHIIMVSGDGSCKEVYAAKKDLWPMWLFQFGNVQFPDAAMKNGNIMIVPTAIQRMDGRTFELTI